MIAYPLADAVLLHGMYHMALCHMVYHMVQCSMAFSDVTLCTLCALVCTLHWNGRSGHLLA